jgi:hypothetical protein
MRIGIYGDRYSDMTPLNCMLNDQPSWFKILHAI